MRKELSEKFRMAKLHLDRLSTALSKESEANRNRYDEYGLDDPMKAMTWTDNAELCDDAANKVIDAEQDIGRVESKLEKEFEEVYY